MKLSDVSEKEFGGFQIAADEAVQVCKACKKIIINVLNSIIVLLYVLNSLTIFK